MLMAVVVWTSSWWAWALFHNVVHAANWSEDKLIRQAGGFFGLFMFFYLIIQAALLKKSGLRWSLAFVRLVFSIAGLSAIAGLAGRKPNAEGLDIVFSFMLAALSGFIIYSKVEKFDIARFFAALAAWLFIISANELLIQSILSFRKAQPADIAHDAAAVLTGLLLSSPWFWTKRAGRFHKLSMLG